MTFHTPWWRARLVVRNSHLITLFKGLGVQQFAFALPWGPLWSGLYQPPQFHLGLCLLAPCTKYPCFLLFALFLLHSGLRTCSSLSLGNTHLLCMQVTSLCLQSSAQESLPNLLGRSQFSIAHSCGNKYGFS